MLEIGSVLDGKYKILNKIGQGGMSVVYLALNERANKTWAIKEIRKNGEQNFSVVHQGLIAETNILKSLNHKYLPSIVDVIDDEETFVIVMDYIQGKSLNVVLRDTLQNEGHPIPAEDVISWGIQLCDVLYYLHTRPNPIIYRDMKPANIMLKPDGEICLIDFGAARVFKTGNSEDTTCLGTPGYAAPEQYGGNGQTRPQTDIYNLGATLHHLVTGRSPEATPFNFPPITQCRPTLLSESPREMRGAILGLEMIISKCTSYEIADRYQDCLALRYDLEHPEDLGAPYRKSLKRKMFGFAACIAAGVILGGVSLGAMAMENSVQKQGYSYYIEEASTASTTDEKIEYYSEAIALDPTDEEAYLEMLDAMLADNTFSVEEDTQLTAILNNKDNNRTNTNKVMLQTNEAGWVEFCYELGVAYYYSYESTNGKTLSVSYFETVSKADMDSLDLGDNDDYKAAWKARAQVLSTIGGSYSKLGQSNEAGDSEYSYYDYWYDLMELFDSDVAGQDNAVTELRLYNEILVQTYTNAYYFKNDGISQEAMEQALDNLEEKVADMEAAGSITGTTALELQDDITENLEAARTAVSTAFGTTALN